MKNSKNLLRPVSSEEAEELKMAVSNRSNLGAGESGFQPSDPLAEWLVLGVPGGDRIAILRATISSIRFQKATGWLHFNTENDGVVMADLSQKIEDENWDGGSVLANVVRGKMKILSVPFDLLGVSSGGPEED
jgi:hypothetical protein